MRSYFFLIARPAHLPREAQHRLHLARHAVQEGQANSSKNKRGPSSSSGGNGQQQMTTASDHNTRTTSVTAWASAAHLDVVDFFLFPPGRPPRRDELLHPGHLGRLLLRCESLHGIRALAELAVTGLRRRRSVPTDTRKRSKKRRKIGGSGPTAELVFDMLLRAYDGDNKNKNNDEDMTATTATRRP